MRHIDKVVFNCRRVLSFFYSRSVDTSYEILFYRVSTALSSIERLDPIIVGKMHPLIMQLISAMDKCDSYKLVSHMTKLYTIVLFLSSMANLRKQYIGKILLSKFPTLLNKFKNDVYLVTGAQRQHDPSLIRYKDLLEKARLYHKAAVIIESIKKLNRATLLKAGIVFTVDGYISAKTLLHLDRALGAERLFSFYWYVPSMYVLVCPIKVYKELESSLKEKELIPNILSLAGGDRRKLVIIGDSKFYSGSILWPVFPVKYVDKRSPLKLSNWDFFKSDTFTTNKELGGF